MTLKKKLYLNLAVFSFLILPLPCSSEQLIGQVKEYLRSCCDYSDTIGFWGKGKNNHIEELDLPMIKKYIPQYHFYFTRLPTGNFEYPIVETIICVEQIGKILKVSVCYSPLFADSCREMQRLFAGRKIANKKDIVPLSREIGSLFCKITLNGSLKNELFLNARYFAELLENKTVWRRIEIKFDSANRIQSIVLVNPKETKDRHSIDSLIGTIKHM